MFNCLIIRLEWRGFRLLALLFVQDFAMIIVPSLLQDDGRDGVHSRLSPREQQIHSMEQQMTPREHQLSPREQQKSPRDQYGSTTEQHISNKEQQVENRYQVFAVENHNNFISPLDKCNCMNMKSGCIFESHF